MHIDILNNPLVNKCDLTQAIVGQSLEKMGADVKMLDTQKAINSDVIGHSFLVVGLPIKSQSGIEEKFYLVDPTYRQFFLSENCSASKYLIKDNMILIALDPEYYYLHHHDKMWIASKIIEEGYIELDNESAKTYGDSFYVTHRGYSTNIDQKKESLVSGNIYAKSFLKTNTDYSLTNEELIARGYQEISSLENKGKQR
jgi:hypothetical protein